MLTAVPRMKILRRLGAVPVHTGNRRGRVGYILDGVDLPPSRERYIKQEAFQGALLLPSQ